MILDWNPAAERIFHYARAEVLGKNFYSLLLPEDDHAAFDQIIDILIRKKSPHNYQNTCYTKNKSTVIINWFNTPIFDAKKDRVFVISFTEDITERTRAEEALRNTNRTYQALIKGSPVSIIMVDKEYQVKMWNPAAEEILGWSNEDVLNKSLPLLSDTEDDELLSYLKMVFLGRSYQNIHLIRRKKGGKDVHLTVSIAPLHDASGKINEAVLIAADTTEHDQAEEALKESEAQNRALLMAMPDLMFRVSQSGQFLDMIPTSDESMINTFSDFLGKNVRDVMPEDLVEETVSGIKGTLKSDEMETLGASFPVDGDPREMEIRIVAAGKKDVLMIFRDITVEKEAQEKIAKALNRAEKSERVKTLFLNNISYELFTPLNSILGFIDLIHKNLEKQLSDEDETFFTSIQESSERLMRTVREITDISQIDAGHYEPQKETVDLVLLTEAQIKRYQDQAQEKSLELSFNSDLEHAHVSIDPHAMVKSLGHILDNAIIYTDEGHIDVNLKSENQHVILTVSDTGIGMSKEYQSQLFEIFTQESTGYTRKYKGLGLGLALTKRYLELNDVEIDVKSAKNKGTIFTLHFLQLEESEVPEDVKEPVAEETESPGKSKEDKPHSPSKIPLILVVEDDANSQRLINFFLKDKYATCFADSVDSAKKQLKKHKPDLVLLDLSLKGNEDGLDFAEFVRNKKSFKNLPIIATTAHAAAIDQERCLAGGCNEYLSKPIKQDELFGKLENFLTV